MAKKTTPKYDITIVDHRSIVLLTGSTRLGAEWLSDHLDPDAARWGAAYVVEPRYVAAILGGALNDGLNV